MNLIARGTIFWILTMNIHISTPVKTEFAKLVYKVDFRGGDDSFERTGYFFPYLVVACMILGEVWILDDEFYEEYSNMINYHDQ